MVDVSDKPEGAISSHELSAADVQPNGTRGQTDYGQEGPDSSNHQQEESFLDFSGTSVMDRAQKALRKQVKATNDRVCRELLEKEQDHRNAKKVREDCGVSLYGMQQQLAKLQTNLDTLSNERDELYQSRISEEGGIESIMKTYSSNKTTLEELRKGTMDSQAEQTALHETIIQVKRYNEETTNEIIVSRRVASKATESAKYLEKDKQTQDIYIDGLNEQIRQMEDDLALSEKQLGVQKGQTAEAKQMLKDTNSELESIASERKQLVLQWKSSLVALKMRDEALQAAEKALRAGQMKVKDNNIEIGALTREVGKSKDKNANLVITRDRFVNENKYIEEAISKNQMERENISERYEILQKSIASSSEDESKVERELSKLKSDTSTIKQKIELVTRERHATEEQIGLHKHDQTTMTNAAKSLVKSEADLLSKIHCKEIEVANVQNELARLKIDSLNTQAHNVQLKEKLESCLSELNKTDKHIEQSEADVKRRNDEIEKKLKFAEQLNRKYNKILEGAEDPELLGPLEATIKSLDRDIDTEEEESQKMQRKWLADQLLLVQTIGSVDMMQEKNAEMIARMNILNQKRLRLVQGIHLADVEVKAIESNIKGMHSDMSRLNDLTSQSTTRYSELTNENKIKEKEFLDDIKELELNMLGTETKIMEVRDNRESILTDIVKFEEETLHWEKKIALEKDTQKALRESSDVYEIKGMEKEIHRMRHRLDAMNRDQEVMIRDIEVAIQRREDIAVKHLSCGRKRDDKSCTKSELSKKAFELKDQMIHMAKDSDEFAAKINTMRTQLQENSPQIETAKNKWSSEEHKSNLLQKEVNKLSFEKQRLLAKTDRRQNALNKYFKLKNNSSTQDSDEFQVEKSIAMDMKKMTRIRNIIDAMRSKFVHLDEVFARVGILAEDVMLS